MKISLTATFTNRAATMSLMAIAVLAIWSSCFGASPPKIEPELPPDQGLLARIEALPENTWMKLPPIKIAGDIAWCSADRYNARNMVKLGPTLRGYSNRMVWAPDRKRALYCGANHQAPHVLNDVWEYDLASNTWVCLCPPDEFPTAAPRGCLRDKDWVKANLRFKEGFVTGNNGGPIRPIHTWDKLCYDPQRRRLLWHDHMRGLWTVRFDQVFKTLGADLKPEDAKLKPGGWIFEFDPTARRYDKVWAVDPDIIQEAQIVAYLPDQKTLWTKGDRGTFLYQPETNTWKPLSSKGQPGYGTIGAYSPDRRVFLVVNTDQTWTYSFALDEWKLVQPKAPAGARDCTGVVCYDTVAKLFVLYTTVGGRKDSLWLFDVAKDQWTDAKPRGDVPPTREYVAGGYYDPDRNVFVHYHNGDIYVYRCKRAAK